MTLELRKKEIQLYHWEVNNLSLAEGSTERENSEADIAVLKKEIADLKKELNITD